jgi:hypothetical protein
LKYNNPADFYLKEFSSPNIANEIYDEKVRLLTEAFDHTLRPSIEQEDEEGSNYG